MLEDAGAYGRWAGGALPTEAQREQAARGGETGERAPSSRAFATDGHPIANTWQGAFPVHDEARDGHAGLAPDSCYPANGYGLVDMIGNAWEWTATRRGKKGVVKRGSFLSAVSYCANYRPAAFQAQEAKLPTSHIGFRPITVAKQTRTT